MRDEPTIAVIGAGMTGLTCARALADAGFQPLVLDKGRGLGGRLATRRVDPDLRFDHGAPYVDTDDPVFSRHLESAQAQGHAVCDATGAGSPRYIGVPGMSGLVRPLAQGLDVRTGSEVTRLVRSAAGWSIELTDGLGGHEADLLICTVPAPQAARLLVEEPELVAQLDAVAFDPCWALLAAFDPPVALPAGPIPDTVSSVSEDSVKPGRAASAQCFVVHASADWSREHLELDRPEAARLLLDHLRATMAWPTAEPVYLAAHRWRYARASKPLGRPHLASADGTLLVGGDWCLGTRAEHAYASGRALADVALERLVASGELRDRQ